jgi:hypothetical protein
VIGEISVVGYPAYPATEVHVRSAIEEAPKDESWRADLDARKRRLATLMKSDFTGKLEKVNALFNSIGLTAVLVPGVKALVPHHHPLRHVKQSTES